MLTVCLFFTSHAWMRVEGVVLQKGGQWYGISENPLLVVELECQCVSGGEVTWSI